MTRTLAVVVLVLLAVPALATSQTPGSTTRLVPVTGVLTDAAGRALTGPQTVTFAIFDVSEGGAALWAETQQVTADDRGRYAARLGCVVPLPLEIFRTEQARWLDVTAGEAALPRTLLVAVPYALKAMDADTLGGTPAAAFVRAGPDGRLQRADGLTLGATTVGPAVDGTGIANQLAKWGTATTLGASVISESVTNRVGVGLPDPTGGGVVDSVFSIKNYDYNTGFAILNETQQRRFAINTLTTGGWRLYDGGNNVWNAGLTQWAGKLGLGAPPLSFAKLYVNAGNSYGILSLSTVLDGIGIRGEADTGTNAVGVYGLVRRGMRGFFRAKSRSTAISPLPAR